MSKASSPDWDNLIHIAETLSGENSDMARAHVEEFKTIGQALNWFVNEKADADILKLADLFCFVLAEDSLSWHEVFAELEKAAIGAAEALEDDKELAHLLSTRGHNLHRFGRHTEALECFRRSQALYSRRGETKEVLQTELMSILCVRALGDTRQAESRLRMLLQDQSMEQEKWRAQPLQVLAWMKRDQGRLQESERLLREAIALHNEIDREDEVVLAGMYADLGDVLGEEHKYAEASVAFSECMAILAKYPGQHTRAEARCLLKHANVLIDQSSYLAAMKMLNLADRLLCNTHGSSDWLWRVELSRSRIYIATGQPVRALRHAWQAFGIWKDLQQPVGSLAKWAIRKAASLLRRSRC